MIRPLPTEPVTSTEPLTNGNCEANEKENGNEESKTNDKEMLTNIINKDTLENTEKEILEKVSFNTIKKKPTVALSIFMFHSFIVSFPHC